MMLDTISELLKFFQAVNSTKRWSIDPDEAVEITLAGANEYLSKDNVDTYANYALEQLGGIGYDRIGENVNFSLSGDEEERLHNILKNSEFCLKKN